MFHVKRRGKSLSYICSYVFDYRLPDYVSREIRDRKHFSVTEIKKDKIIRFSYSLLVAGWVIVQITNSKAYLKAAYLKANLKKLQSRLKRSSHLAQKAETRLDPKCNSNAHHIIMNTNQTTICDITYGIETTKLQRLIAHTSRPSGKEKIAI